MSIERIVSTQPEIKSGNLLTFPKGIPGFEKHTSFKIYHKDVDGISAFWLESTENADVTFTLVDPTVYDLNYELNLNDEEQKLINADDPNDIAVFLMLSKPVTGGDKETSLNANIAGPLIMNLKEKLGIQKVIGKPTISVQVAE